MPRSDLETRSPSAQLHPSGAADQGVPSASPDQTNGQEPRLHPVRIAGTGSYVPERVLTNADLERMVDTSDDWIVSRTGMRERRIAAPGEATSDLACAAGRAALEKAGVAPKDVDFIVIATVTPDTSCPPTACRVQHMLGAENAMAFDLSAACSGFINALSVGHQFVATGARANALVIGADVLSSITNYEDRESCILFGDAAGATVLTPGRGRGQLLDHLVGVDGAGGDLIIVPAGGSARPASHETIDAKEHYLQMAGRRVYKFAVHKFEAVVRQILERNGKTVDDLDVLVPHQANARIIEAAASRLGIGMDRVLMNIDRYGNSSAGSVPLALDEAARNGMLEEGDLACMVAFGGGLTWGASLCRW